MNKHRLVLFACLMSCIAMAQQKSNTQWKCDKPSKQYSIDIGDKPGHAYALDQINCTATRGELGGVKEQSGLSTEFLEINGDKVAGHGEFVETMANGEKNFYTYQLNGTLKNGALQAGSDKWTLREGSGKLRGAKGSGTCKGQFNPDQSTTWDCPGTYTLSGKSSQ